VRDSSFDRLVVEHLPAALALATRLAGEPNAAEEIVQEALVRVVRSWPAFRGEAAFRTWFFRILINVFRDRLRKQTGGELSLDESPVELAATRECEPPQAAMAAELAERVAAEVSRLPPRQREVLVLSVYEGMSTREVARVVGISEGNVHSTLSAARLRLKARLAPYLKSVEKTTNWTGCLVRRAGRSRAGKRWRGSQTIGGGCAPSGDAIGRLRGWPRRRASCSLLESRPGAP
jgi:RNA polymerase sigma-70 factor (ECF subfamily)